MAESMLVLGHKGGPPPVLTVENGKNVLMEAGVRWTWQLYGGGLRLRNKTLKKKKIQTLEEKWKFSIEYWLSIDPTPSWRRIICAVDYYDKQHKAASKLYKYAEPVTDPTITQENVLLVLKEVTNLTNLCRYLRVPDNERNRSSINAIAEYFISYCCHPTWMKLASKLFYLNEDKALEVVRTKFMPTPLPRDPSLTVESMYAVVKRVDWNRGLRGEKIDIPWSKCTDIKKQYKDNPIERNKAVYKMYLDTHPAPSWKHIAEGLYQAREHYVLKQVKRKIKVAEGFAAYHQAIKEKGATDEVYVHGIFCGLAKSGKSSFMSRLARNRFFKDASRSVAEKKASMEVCIPKLSRSVVVVEGLDWNQLDVISVADETLRTILPHVSTYEKKTSWMHYLSDVKGQPEFQEHLHLLISGNSIFYHVFRADLNFHEVEHLSPDGESFKTVMSTKESILQFLANITLIQVTRNPKGGNLPQPKVLFIATHVDKLESKVDKIKEIDRDLQNIVKATQAFEDGMIVSNSESCMLFPVNNCSDDDTAFQSVRARVNQVVTGSDDYHISVPYTWSLFSTRIKHFAEQVLSYDTCLDVGKNCGIETKEDMDNCLWFLHNQTGLVRHFKEVPEFVINNPQYIFDKMEDLIMNTFTFEKLHGNMHSREKFVKKGIFSTQNFKNSDDVISSSQLLKLLKHLCIVVPLGNGGEYFFPCALVRRDNQENPAAAAAADSQCHPSLFFTFSCGFCPYGLFGPLVADFFHPGPDLDFEWEFKQNEIFRNQICFSVGPFLDKFQFTVASNHVSIDILPEHVSERKKPTIHEICDHVRLHTESSLSNVIHMLNYNIDLKQAFYCPIQNCCRSHFAYVRFFKKVPWALECSVNYKTSNFPEECEIWFDKTAQEPSSPLDKDDYEDVSDEVSSLAARWYPFGTKLHLSMDLLDTIEKDNKGNAECCLCSVLKKWLKKNYNVKRFGEPTWSMLVEAVKAGNGGADAALAEKITKNRIIGYKRYKSEPGPVTSTHVKKIERADSWK